MKSSHKIGLISLISLASTACGTAAVPHVASAITAPVEVSVTVNETGHHRPGPHAEIATMGMAKVMHTNVYSHGPRLPANYRATLIADVR